MVPSPFVMEAYEQSAGAVKFLRFKIYSADLFFSERLFIISTISF